MALLPLAAEPSSYAGVPLPATYSALRSPHSGTAQASTPTPPTPIPASLPAGPSLWCWSTTGLALLPQTAESCGLDPARRSTPLLAQQRSAQEGACCGRLSTRRRAPFRLLRCILGQAPT